MICSSCAYWFSLVDVTPMYLTRPCFLCRDVAEVVHLHQIDDRLLDPGERRIDLRPRRRRVCNGVAAPGHVDLGGPEDLVGEPGFGRDASGDLFRRAVARGGVEHRAAFLDQRLEHAPHGGQILRAGNLRKGGRAAEADHRNLFAARGNRPADDRLGLEGDQGPRVEGERRAGAGGQREPFSSCKHVCALFQVVAGLGFTRQVSGRGSRRPG